jgi:hypothetical protein
MNQKWTAPIIGILLCMSGILWAYHYWSELPPPDVPRAEWEGKGGQASTSFAVLYVPDLSRQAASQATVADVVGLPGKAWDEAIALLGQPELVPTAESEPLYAVWPSAIDVSGGNDHMQWPTAHVIAMSSTASRGKNRIVENVAIISSLGRNLVEAGNPLATNTDRGP